MPVRFVFDKLCSRISFGTLIFYHKSVGLMDFISLISNKTEICASWSKPKEVIIRMMIIMEVTLP